ncbi:ankyrin repeat-containing domain protein, partial [Podospora aff. communis PSN243]
MLARAWKDAPGDIHQLKEDLGRAERFFGETSEGLHSIYERKYIRSSELGQLLNDGAAVLERIEGFIDELQIGSHDGIELNARRRLVWMTSRPRLAQLRNELQAVMSSLCRLLIAHNISVSAEIQVSIAKARDEVIAHVDKRIEASQDATATQLANVLAVSHSSVVSHLDARFGHSIKAKSAAGNRTLLEDEDYVPSRHQTSSRCSPTCDCECHSPTRYCWSMAALQMLVGSVMLRYQSQTPRRCTTIQCRGSGRPRRSIRVEYKLPHWLIRASLTVMFSTSNHGSPELVLRLVNHVPDTVTFGESMFGLIRSGDVEGMKVLLRRGEAPIHDRFGSNFLGALGYAVTQKSAPIVRLLLQAGADPYQPDGPNLRITTASRITVMFIQGYSPTEDTAALIREFPISSYLEDFEFNLLHKAVVGIAGISVADALANPQCLADVNSRTLNFLSPLQLAAIRDDASACRLLVQAGADVDASHPMANSTTALHRACYHGNYAAAKALIALGASTTLKDDSGTCAMSWAVRAPGTKLMRLVMDHGGDVHSVNNRGAQPLTIAAEIAADTSTMGLDRVVFLLDRGADINHQNRYGATPLLSALAAFRVESPRLLLARGADPGVCNHFGQGLLHYAAISAGEATFAVLAGFAGLLKEKGLDVNARDESGKTAREL